MREKTRELEKLQGSRHGMYSFRDDGYVSEDQEREWVKLHAENERIDDAISQVRAQICALSKSNDARLDDARAYLQKVIRRYREAVDTSVALNLEGNTIKSKAREELARLQASISKLVEERDAARAEATASRARFESLERAVGRLIDERDKLREPRTVFALAVEGGYVGVSKEPTRLENATLYSTRDHAALVALRSGMEVVEVLLDADGAVAVVDVKPRPAAPAISCHGSAHCSRWPECETCGPSRLR